MRRESQAYRLEKLVRKNPSYPLYELCFPPVLIRKKAFKKLQPNDLLLIGMDRMEMSLLSEHHGCAKVLLSGDKTHQTLQVTGSFGKTRRETHSKKYKIIKILLALLQSSSLERGHRIETTQIDFDHISLYTEEGKIADARLVTVDDEIAVQIKEVTPS